MRTRTIGVLVLLACLAPQDDAGIPPGSRARAERYLEWSERLAAAERALADGRLEQAEQGYTGILDEATEAERRSLPYTRALDGLADLRRLQGRPAEARDLYVQAVGLWEALLGPSQPRLAVTLHNLGLVQMELAECPAAQESLERALGLWESSFGTDSVEAAASRRALRAVDAACGAPARDARAQRPPLTGSE